MFIEPELYLSNQRESHLVEGNRVGRVNAVNKGHGQSVDVFLLAKYRYQVGEVHQQSVARTSKGKAS